MLAQGFGGVRTPVGGRAIDRDVLDTTVDVEVSGDHGRACRGGEEDGEGVHGDGKVGGSGVGCCVLRWMLRCLFSTAPGAGLYTNLFQLQRF